VFLGGDLLPAGTVLVTPAVCTVLKNLSPFAIFEQLALALKNRVALKSFTVLNIHFTFRIFNNLRLP